MVDVFTLGYFVWLSLMVVLFILMYYILKNRSERTKYIVLLVLAISTWLIHFSRLGFEPNFRIHTIVFQDLCGLNTLLLPFLMLSKKRFAKHIMFFSGALFAMHSMVYPNNIIGDPWLSYNTTRFFFAHFLLIAIPLWLISFKMYTPTYKAIPGMFVFILIGSLYNMAVSATMVQMGLTDHLYNFMGLWGNRDDVYQYSEIIAPFLRYNSEVNGEIVSKPIPFLYMIPTLLLVYVPVWFFMSLPFVRKNRVNLESETE